MTNGNALRDSMLFFSVFSVQPTAEWKQELQKQTRKSEFNLGPKYKKI
jgi:hypothetical protein